MAIPGRAAHPRARKAGRDHDREHHERARDHPLARHRAPELPRRRARMERLGLAPLAIDRAARFAHRQLHAAARGHVHVPLALQRVASDRRWAYGPIIVVEPGQKFDPATDKILFFGAAGLGANPVYGPFPAVLMNGKEQPYDMDLKAGTQYRFRLLNLAGDGPTIVALNCREGSGHVARRREGRLHDAGGASDLAAGRAACSIRARSTTSSTHRPRRANSRSMFGPPPNPPASTAAGAVPAAAADDHGAGAREVIGTNCLTG